MADLDGHTFGFMLRSLVPLVMAPPGPLPPKGTQLRGVVRSNERHARVAFSSSTAMTDGMAYEFTLRGDGDGQELCVEAAVDWLRTAIFSQETIATTVPVVRDSHNNEVVDANKAGFNANSTRVWYDQDLFSTLSVMIHGGGFPWFEDIYTCNGFMLGANNRVRIYIRIPHNAETLGIELPLMVEPHANVYPGFGSLPQELVPLVRDGGLLALPSIDKNDDYCSNVFDLTEWLAPTA